jgi:hypothetical protein
MSDPRAPSRGRDPSRRGRSVGGRSSTLRWAIVFGVVALIAAVIAFLLTRKGPGEQFPNLGQDHIEASTPVAYNSDPPTSGPHLGTPSRWGILDGPVDDRALVHNLEHGGVVVYYNPASVTGADLTRLKAQVSELLHVNQRIILVPRPTLNTAMALTAWTYLQRLDSYDPGEVEDFFDAHVGKGPECTPNCPP